jgi:putative methyltransferase (TIGR04325 family)
MTNPLSLLRNGDLSLISAVPGAGPADTLVPRLFGNCRGLYSTSEEAMGAIPPHRRAGYDHNEAATLYSYALDTIRPSDYAALYWMSRYPGCLERVFDYGGNVGSAFYAYRARLNFPAACQWTVCEVPSVAIAGECLASERGETHLSFTTQFERASGATVLITNGALQYIEQPLASRLAALHRKPHLLLINRVAHWNRRAFITLQDIGMSLCPYFVCNREEFITSLTALGYELLDSWNCPESSCRVRFQQSHHIAAYSGYFFRCATSDTF